MTDSIRQYTPADDRLAALVLETIHKLQHSRGYDTRSSLHHAVMVELGDPDEQIVDDTVYDYCYDANLHAERGEEPFTDVKL
jgi:hypothetical protein